MDGAEGAWRLSHVQLLATPWTGPTRLLCPWDSPGKNIEVGSHSPLQGIFPTQGLNPGLLNCRWIIYHLIFRDGNSKILVYQLPWIKEEKKRHRQNTDEFYGSEMILYNTVMMILIIIHLSKPKECTKARVNLNVNYNLCII